jgi:hypothetical protein
MSDRRDHTMELSFYALYLGMYTATPRGQYCHLEDIEGSDPDREDHRRYMGRVGSPKVSLDRDILRWEDRRLPHRSGYRWDHIYR